jgi:Putative beta-barrel porin 2
VSNLTRVRIATALAVASLVLVSAPVAAQRSAEPDPATVRIRLGPLWVKPTVALTNIGIDNNVFNQPDDLNPKSDFTFTATPAADLWLRMGRTWLVGRIAEDFNWYQTYASERNASTAYSIGWHIPLARLGFKVDAGRRNARDRPGFEIDARVPRVEDRLNGLFELKTFSKTFIGVTATRLRTDYDENSVFQGTSLRFQLNRTTTGLGLSVRHELTPLTSISVTAGRYEDRFDYSPLRNSMSTNVSGNITFDKFALIRGGATLGYTDFQPEVPGLASYQGLTGAVNLSYTLLGSTRFGFEFGRDVQYSYDVTQPYYLQTRLGGSIAQQIFGPLDVVVRGSFGTLAYRDRTGVDVVVSNRVDDVSSFGAGIGYHLGRDTRLGFNVDQSYRRSDISNRQYNNLTFGSSVTYGF